MKRIIAGLFLTVLALAQTPDPTQAFEASYTAMRGPVTDLIVAYNNLKVANANLGDYIKTLEARLDWMAKLQAKCPDCQAALTAALDGKEGTYQPVPICCGPTTVPPTQPDTAILYITRQP